MKLQWTKCKKLFHLVSEKYILRNSLTIPPFIEETALLWLQTKEIFSLFTECQPFTWLLVLLTLCHSHVAIKTFIGIDVDLLGG